VLKLGKLLTTHKYDTIEQSAALVILFNRKIKIDKDQQKRKGEEKRGKSFMHW
jgi:hypothetical protein